MFGQMLAMLGIDNSQIEEMKTQAKEFGIRFAAMEQKVNALYERLEPRAPALCETSPRADLGDTSDHSGK